MTEQQKEIETIKPRTYSLNLSDADVKRIAKTAGAYGLTVSELLENFIGDLVAGTYSNGSDERMYADQWAERCWFSLDPEKNLVQYLCSEAWEFDFSDLMNVLERIDDIKSDIDLTKKNIAEPDDKWKDIVYHKYNDDRTSYECVPCYNSLEEYVASEKQDLVDYQESLEEALEELKDYQNSFDTYMNGKEYVWEEEVQKATIWYKENIADKLDITSAEEVE
ncbi:MAG: hypothetical protein MR531_05430 [Lachnospiraceae bacterium]|nr:hypothetical protein [Lachnospiraceae bacterium]